ncbi:MAG: hypothetical protein ABIE68_01400 [bacterium]
MTEKNLSWKKVEEFLAEKSNGSAAMALLETEKILAQIFSKLGYPGKTVDENIQLAKPLILNYKDLKISHDLVKKVKEETDITVTTKEADKLLEAYYEAIRDIMKNKKHGKTISLKFKLFWNNLFHQESFNWKKFSVYLIIFFFVVWLLNKTAIGLSVVNLVVAIANFIFSWFLLTALLIVSILGIIIGSIFFFEGRKKKAKIRTEE